jgi:integration host factor subunit alpha
MGAIIMAIGRKSITRVDLYDAVYRAVGLSRSKSAGLAELVLMEITDCLARGETVKLSSFGTFTVRKKGQRLGRNPKTGADALISPRRVVVFKASGIMKRQINSDHPIQRRNESAAAAGETILPEPLLRVPG